MGITLPKLLVLIAGIFIGLFALVVGANKYNYPLNLIAGPFIGTISLYCIGFALKGDTPGFKLVVKYSLIGGLIVGGVGFILGFFGPIIFHPEANQGPLLGIFITGPSGFVLGVMGGLVYGIYRNKT